MDVDLPALVARVTGGEHCLRCWLPLATDTDYDAMQDMRGFGTDAAPFNAWCWSRFGDCHADDDRVVAIFRAVVDYVQRTEVELAVERDLAAAREAELRSALFVKRISLNAAKAARRELATLRLRTRTGPEPEHGVLATSPDDPDAV